MPQCLNLTEYSLQAKFHELIFLMTVKVKAYVIFFFQSVTLLFYALALYFLAIRNISFSEFHKSTLPGLVIYRTGATDVRGT